MNEEEMRYIFPATSFLPFVAEKGKGVFLYDTEGNKYLDLNSGQFCLVLGYGDEGLFRLLVSQYSKLIHTGTSCISVDVIEATQKIRHILTGGLTNIILLSTGAEAVECAIRYSKIENRKNGVLSASLGYHGLTLATQAITLGGGYANPSIINNYHLPIPNHFNKEHTLDFCIESAVKTFHDYGDKCSCIVLEPVLSVGGIIELPKEYLEVIKELCIEYNVNLIFDECQTGFGRTGEWFAYQKHGINPDILVSAKAMGLGFPVSMVAFNDSVRKAAIETKISHFSSHQNDPLAASICSYLIDVIAQKNLLHQIREKGEYFREHFITKFKEKTIFENFRGIGLIMGFDLSCNISDVDCLAFSNTLISKARENGILLQATNKGRTFRLLPAYIISFKEIDLFLEKLFTSVCQLEAAGVL